MRRDCGECCKGWGKRGGLSKQMPAYPHGRLCRHIELAAPAAPITAISLEHPHIHSSLLPLSPSHAPTLQFNASDPDPYLSPNTPPSLSPSSSSNGALVGGVVGGVVGGLVLVGVVVGAVAVARGWLRHAPPSDPLAQQEGGKERGSGGDELCWRSSMEMGGVNGGAGYVGVNGFGLPALKGDSGWVTGGGTTVAASAVGSGAGSGVGTPGASALGASPHLPAPEESAAAEAAALHMWVELCNAGGHVRPQPVRSREGLLAPVKGGGAGGLGGAYSIMHAPHAHHGLALVSNATDSHPEVAIHASGQNTAGGVTGVWWWTKASACVCGLAVGWVQGAGLGAGRVPGVSPSPHAPHTLGV